MITETVDHRFITLRLQKELEKKFTSTWLYPTTLPINDPNIIPAAVYKIMVMNDNGEQKIDYIYFFHKYNHATHGYTNLEYFELHNFGDDGGQDICFSSGSVDSFINEGDIPPDSVINQYMAEGIATFIWAYHYGGIQ